VNDLQALVILDLARAAKGAQTALNANAGISTTHGLELKFCSFCPYQKEETLSIESSEQFLILANPTNSEQESKVRMLQVDLLVHSHYFYWQNLSTLNADSFRCSLAFSNDDTVGVVSLCDHNTDKLIVSP